VGRTTFVVTGIWPSVAVGTLTGVVPIGSGVGVIMVVADVLPGFTGVGGGFGALFCPGSKNIEA
jgi:hypothetical protein